jgi:hypothetical protein
MDQQPLDEPKKRRGRKRRDRTSLPAGEGLPPGVVEDGTWSAAKFRSYVRGAIRRIEQRWPAKLSVLQRVRIELPKTKKNGEPGKNAVWYKCEECGTLGKPMHSPKQNALAKEWRRANKKALKYGLEPPPRPDVPVRVWVDHKDPVVPIDREIGWDDFVNRLFCVKENYQVLCDDCHTRKSLDENARRREWRLSLKSLQTEQDAQPDQFKSE